MPFELPPLPYALDALAPHMSRETLEFHHGKHHQAYVTKTNERVKGTRHEGQTLEEILLNSEGPLFNSAAQAWNHDFFWKCLKPNGGGEPTGELGERIRKDFGSFDEFKTKFTQTATGHFASGWTWLSMEKSGKLAVESSPNAQNPLTQGRKPLLTCDVWEHAYYIDYRNQRPKYLEAFWNLVNWEFVTANLK